jgi:hypothetical protein
LIAKNGIKTSVHFKKEAAALAFKPGVRAVLVGYTL